VASAADLTSRRDGAAQRPLGRRVEVGRFRRFKVWWRKDLRPFWRDVRWVVIGVVAVVAVGLGWWGFDEYVGDSRSFGDKLYLGIQLFGLESGNVDPPVPWQLEVARVLAPLVAVYAAVSAATAVLREQLQLLRVRFLNDHVVVCGLGARGLALAKGFNEMARHVVAIEKEDDARGIGECREEGIIVLIGDATDRAMLRKARAGKARYLVAVGPDDGVNAEVAADLPELLNRRGRSPLTAFVHMTDPALCGLLRRGAKASPGERSYELEFFSVYEIAAHALVSEYVPMAREDGTAQVPGRIVVVGVGHMGEALVLHASKAWHAVRGRSEQKLRVTIVDDEAERKWASLLERYPQLAASCDLLHEEMNIKEAKFSRARFLFDYADGPAASVVFVCLGDDALGLRAAQALLPAVKDHGIPVVVRMSQHAGLATLLDEDVGGEGAECLRAFPLLDRTSTPELLLDGPREQLARLIQEEREPAKAWEKLDRRDREWGRREADRVSLKLGLLRCGIEPLTDWDAEVAEFTTNEVRALATLEWEYRFGTGEDDNGVRESELRAARGLPTFLAQAGLRVYRLDG
jgi:hypothetical protein